MIDTLPDMYLGVNSFLWVAPYGDEHQHLAAHAASLGYDALEVVIDDPAAVDASVLRDACVEHRLRLTVCGIFSPARDLAADDEDLRAAGVRYLRELADFCADAGAATLVGPMTTAVGERRLFSPAQRAERIAWSSDGLRQAAAYAATRHVRLALEPIPRFESDLVNTVAQGLEICEATGADNVGLLLDTYAMHLEEDDPIAAIHHAGSRVFAVHAVESQRGTPGTGQVNWSGVLQALSDVGYDGSVVVEAFTAPSDDLRLGVCGWRDMAESPNALARDALAFLRGRMPAHPT